MPNAMNGRQYIVMLNLKNASEGMISENELYDKHLQSNVHNFMIWGMASTEEEALKETLKNLCNMEILQISLAEKELCDFVANYGGREAMRHCWIDENSEPHLLPRADVLSDFCAKYKLPPEAKQELERLFSSETEARGQFF